MTLVLTVDSEFNNPDAPYITLYDPIESRDGSLFLWDAGLHDTTFAINGAIPNLLSEYSLASNKTMKLAKGVGSQGDHDLQLTFQKTPKGGLHIMAAHAGSAPSSGERLLYAVQSEQTLNEYLFNQIKNNPNLYISFWQRVTRVAKTDAGKNSLTAVYAAGNTSNKVFEFNRVDSIPAVSSTSKKNTSLALPSQDVAALNLPNCIQMGIVGELGTGLDANTRSMSFGTGALGPYSRSQTINTEPSLVIYRVYVEDLKASGRTYEQVKAIDDAEFAKAFGVGGRFYGDTWSDPATVLP